MIEIICPVCGEKLEKADKTYRCIRGHVFDVAKQGYVNLLVKKNSKNPGDDKEMVKARQNFLNSGFYENISEKVNSSLEGRASILDVGCGEGYYTNRLQNATNAEIFGVDISKEAIKIAAKKNKKVQFLVGTGVNLPFESGSFESVLCMFSKIFSKEYSRVLKDGGQLLVVSSGKHHLLELRELLYDDVWVDEVDLEAETGEQFDLIGAEELAYKINLESKQEIMNLVRMTPYYYKAKKERVANLEKLDVLEGLTVDVKISLYAKKG